MFSHTAPPPTPAPHKCRATLLNGVLLGFFPLCVLPGSLCFHRLHLFVSASLCLVSCRKSAVAAIVMLHCVIHLSFRDAVLVSLGEQFGPSN